MFGKGSNVLVLLDMFGNMAMAKVELEKIPVFLNGVKLIDSGIKEKRKIQIIFVKRGEETLDNVDGNMILRTGDRVVLFGEFKNIREAFERSD